MTHQGAACDEERYTQFFVSFSSTVPDAAELSSGPRRYGISQHSVKCNVTGASYTVRCPLTDINDGRCHDGDVVDV